MNEELLERIEKLEQAVRDIWASCSCLTKEMDVDLPDLPEDGITFCPEPEEPELPEESDRPDEEPEGCGCEDGCPSCTDRECKEINHD